MSGMETKVGPLRKYAMWYEVQQLQQRGLNVSQISRETGKDRNTIRKYLRMSEEEFLRSESYKRQYELKLDGYEGFVVKQLKQFPYLSAAQVEDKLKEQYGNELGVCSKTIYNFVSRMRERHGLPKRPEEVPRAYEKQPETPYGEYAQADFGEHHMRRASGSPVKIYFFVMVLCRSRYKYAHFSLQPFTTATAVYAHELAFDYFGGIPRKIIYDQDRVLIRDENLGQLMLTHGFRTFVDEQHFECVFCRKADPESKGKVENAVGYVKHNFLSGRLFEGIEATNQQGLEWLDRTGNGSVHHGIHQIPSDLFAEERAHLLPYHGTPTPPRVEMVERLVRKDNVINFRCCYYSVPTGTYRGSSTTVHVEEKDGKLYIYSKETGKMIAEHDVSTAKGILRRDPGHLRDRTSSLGQLEERIRDYVGASDGLDLYLSGLSRTKSRYYRDNLNYIIRNMEDIAPQTLSEAMARCLSCNSYHAPTWIDAAKTLQKRKGEQPLARQTEEPMQACTTAFCYNDLDITPSRSNIDAYNRLFYGE